MMKKIDSNKIKMVRKKLKEYLKASEPIRVNSEAILIHWFYSDCIYTTILDFQDLGLYLRYK